jgi:ribosome-binding protein aMBF1 (putative translation factor)
MTEKCARCEVSGELVRLFDAIYEGKMGRICERCAIIENIPLIKKPSSTQIKESERGIRVYDRMKRLSGIKTPVKQETFFREDRLKELEHQPQLELPEIEKLNLIDHFHWEIMKIRRKKGFTQQKLAETLGESEIVIRMIENAKLPENAEVIIRKIEQFLQINLRKVTERERFLRSYERKPILMDESGNELDLIPEEIIISEETEEDELRKLGGVDIEKGEFDIRKADLSEVRISDLKALNRKRIESTKQERSEEQKRIEERQKLIEARKEELRFKREKETEDLDKSLGGVELFGKDSKKETKTNEESDEELI